MIFIKRLLRGARQLNKHWVPIAVGRLHRLTVSDLPAYTSFQCDFSCPPFKKESLSSHQLCPGWPYNPIWPTEHSGPMFCFWAEALRSFVDVNCLTGALGSTRRTSRRQPSGGWASMRERTKRPHQQKANLPKKPPCRPSADHRNMRDPTGIRRTGQLHSPTLPTQRLMSINQCSYLLSH